MKKKKKILITGGTGYLGSNIINTLKGSYDFVLLKRKSSDLHRIEGSIKNLIICEIEDLTQAFVQGLNIEILLHCATDYGRKNSEAVDIIEANLLLPLRLLSLFQKVSNPIIFINTDTILDKHINVYSLSKSQFKDWMKFFSKSNIFINIQLEHFYGPSDDKTKFVSYLIDSFISEVPVLNLTKGEQNRYFTYIDDVVSAFDIIIKNSHKFTSGFIEFQVSSDEPVNIKNFINIVKELTYNRSTKLNFGAVSYREGELMDFLINSSALRGLGWVPKTSLEQGLKKTIEIDKQKI